MYRDSVALNGPATVPNLRAFEPTRITNNVRANGVKPSDAIASAPLNNASPLGEIRIRQSGPDLGDRLSLGCIWSVPHHFYEAAAL